MASKFRLSEIRALGLPVSEFMRAYGYERRTLERVEAGTAREDTIARAERDFAEFKDLVKTQGVRKVRPSYAANS